MTAKALNEKARFRMGSFDTVRQKIAHSKLHLESLDAEIHRYMSSHPGEVVPNPESYPDRPTFLYRQKEVIPARISLLFGDCLQNLRSAFDYLIWELVLAAGNVPGKTNMFPVCTTAESFKDAKQKGRLKGIPAGAEELVQKLQPYTFAEPSEHWLEILDKLTNINKHRRILLTFLNAFSMSGLMADLEQMIICQLPTVPGVIHNTSSANILTAEQLKMEGDLVTFVAFNEGAVKGMAIELTAETLIGVTTDALAKFEQFFA